MVAAAGAGPAPIPHQELTVDALAEGIQYCLTERAATAASVIANKMNSESGVHAAVASFHQNLPLERLQCDLCPGQPAVWSISKNHRKIKISKVAAEILVTGGSISRKSLVMYVKCLEAREPLFCCTFSNKLYMVRYATNQIVIENRRWDPLTGGASAVMSTTTDLTASILGTFYKPFQEYQNYQDCRKDRPSCSTPDQTTTRSTSRSSLGSTSLWATDRGEGLDTASSSSQAPSDHSKTRLVGRMAGASIKSLGSFFPVALKGMSVDIPLAMTEGMRNVPRYYGEEPRDHGLVTDIKSGFTVAGKGFAWGMAEAVSDIVVKPYQGIQEDGARGAVKGIGKGMANMASKAGCAMFGVIVYPGAGIAKSLKSSIYSRTRKKIIKARHIEGTWLLENAGCTQLYSGVVAKFQGQFNGKKG